MPAADKSADPDVSTWHPKIREFHQYWLLITPSGKKLPARADFDPMALPHLLPNLILLDVVGRPPRFRYRVVGTRMVESLGADLTGRWMDEAHARDGKPPALPVVTKVALEGVLNWRRGPPLFANYIDKCTGLERLFLPLSTNGTDIDMLFWITVFFDAEGKEL